MGVPPTARLRARCCHDQPRSLRVGRGGQPATFCWLVWESVVAILSGPAARRGAEGAGHSPPGGRRFGRGPRPVRISSRSKLLERITTSRTNRRRPSGHGIASRPALPGTRPGTLHPPPRGPKAGSVLPGPAPRSLKGTALGKPAKRQHPSPCEERIVTPPCASEVK